MKNIPVSLLIIVLICRNTQAADLFRNSGQDENTNPAFTPCDDDVDCQEYQTGVCIGGLCECNGTRFCEDTVATVVSKIGGICKINADCNIEHSVCKDNKCTCAEGRVKTENGRKCLKLADKTLGSTCEDSVQCYTRVKHSGCQNDTCVCQQQMHEYEGECYRNVALGQRCQLTGECSATEFSRCIGEKCKCKEGYVQSKDGNKCLEVPKKYNGPCTENVQCSNFGKSVCKEGICDCEELYQYKLSRNMCVRDLLLGEKCENHTDCHGPEGGESRSECVLGECKCQSEYIEEFGFCTNSDQPCIGESSCTGLDPEEYRRSCIPGRCECEEERPYCTNNMKTARKATRNKPRKLEIKKEYDKKVHRPFDFSLEERQFLKDNAYYMVLTILLSFNFIYVCFPEYRIVLMFYVFPAYLYFIIVFIVWVVDVEKDLFSANLTVFGYLASSCSCIIAIYITYQLIPIFRHDHRDDAPAEPERYDAVRPPSPPRGRRRRR